MIILSFLWRLFEEMTVFSYEKYKISINSKIPKSQILFDIKSPLQYFIKGLCLCLIVAALFTGVKQLKKCTFQICAPL